MNSEFPTFQQFSLSRQEYEILVTLQATKASLYEKCYTGESELKPQMRNWISDWLDLLCQSDLISSNAIPDNEACRKAVAKLARLPLLKRHIIAFEVYLFEAYFEIGKRMYEGLGKKCFDVAAVEASRQQIMTLLEPADITVGLFWRANEYFDEGIRKFRPGRLFERVAIGAVAAVLLSVTAGLAAPAIGAAVGGLFGLSGAAATSAGLAFLGGGSLAAGGFGMFGGTIALIGGGALIGGAAGASGFALIQSPKLLVRELAKFYAIVKLFFPLLSMKDKEVFVTDVELGLRKFRNDLRSEIARIEASGTDKEKENAKRMKESLECLESFRSWFQEV